MRGLTHTMRVLSLTRRITTTALPLTNHQVAATTLADVLPPFDASTCLRRIFLLRHGETDWNRRHLMQGGGFDIALNENGRRQAKLVAQEFVGVTGVGVVASSHLQRARQTADILHESLLDKHSERGLVIPRVSLSEFGEMRFGELEGNALRGPESKFTWPGGGESTGQVEQRGRTGLERLYEDFPTAQSIAIVAHGRLNKVLLASLLCGDALKYPEVEQGNTCINVIDHMSDGGYREVLLSYVDHLYRYSS